MVDCAVILAVGSTTHLSQLVYSRPRPMLPVLGKPMVVRTMDRLYHAGIKHYIVIVGEDEGAVASYLNAHWLPNVQIEFVIQSSHSSLTRTLAAIARQYGKPFILTAYNSFTHPNFPKNLLNHYQEVGQGLLLSGARTSLSKSKPQHYAEIEDNRVKTLSREKPLHEQVGFALANLAVLGAEVLDYLEVQAKRTGGFSRELMDVLTPYVQNGGVTNIAETNWILQIEADYDLLTLNKLLLDDGQDAHILSEIPNKVQLIPPVRIDPSVSIGQGAKIGPHVYLESGCSVGHHATVSNAIILQNTILSARSTTMDAVVASRVHITNPDLAPKP